MTRYARWSQKLLDGRYRWGHASAQTGHLGAESIWILVYPPESTQGERRCARLVRFWIVLAVGVLLPSTLVLTALTGVTVSTIALIGLTLAVAVRVVTGSVASRVRRRSIERYATVSKLTPRTTDRAQYEYIARIAERMDTAEHELDQGVITWESYREIWTEHYWKLIRGT